MKKLDINKLLITTKKNKFKKTVDFMTVNNIFVKLKLNKNGNKRRTK